MNESNSAFRQIRASYDSRTIRVYQAYSDAIAESALRQGKFVSPPFSMTRMTWIKPSFLWMMYRAGWGKKDAGQKRILAIDIRRDGFEWALANSCLSYHDLQLHENIDTWRAQLAASPVRIQWDPERDINLEPLDHRSIQIGLRDDAVRRYVTDWITNITDLTTRSAEIHERVLGGDRAAAQAMLPVERNYPLPMELRERLSMI
jgi:hypothetical protein